MFDLWVKVRHDLYSVIDINRDPKSTLQDALKPSQFGAQPQALQPEATLKEGLVKLA